MLPMSFGGGTETVLVNPLQYILHTFQLYYLNIVSNFQMRNTEKLPKRTEWDFWGQRSSLSDVLKTRVIDVILFSSEFFFSTCPFLIPYLTCFFTLNGNGSFAKSIYSLCKGFSKKPRTLPRLPQPRLLPNLYGLFRPRLTDTATVWSLFRFPSSLFI